MKNPQEDVPTLAQGRLLEGIAEGRIRQWGYTLGQLATLKACMERTWIEWVKVPLLRSDPDGETTGVLGLTELGTRALHRWQFAIGTAEALAGRPGGTGARVRP
jgi:hypothetical protein